MKKIKSFKCYKKVFSVIIIMLLLLLNNISMAGEIAPNPNQFIEFRLLEIIQDENNTGRGTQIIVGLFAHNLDFGGFDLRLGYDPDTVVLSDINTNEPIPRGTQLFSRMLQPATDTGSRIHK